MKVSTRAPPLQVLSTVEDAHIFASMKVSLIFIDDADIGKHISVELGNLLEEGAHYARWALASYGWMLYTWANPRGGLAMAFSGEGLCTYGTKQNHLLASQK